MLWGLAGTSQLSFSINTNLSGDGGFQSIRISVVIIKFIRVGVNDRGESNEGMRTPAKHSEHIILSAMLRNGLHVPMKMILAEFRSMTLGTYLMSQMEQMMERRTVDSNT